MAMSNSQTLQANTKPPQANVEPLLAGRVHSSTDPLPPWRDSEPPQIMFLTYHLASQATNKRKSYA